MEESSWRATRTNIYTIKHNTMGIFLAVFVEICHAILYLWQLPQNLLGLLFISFLKCDMKEVYNLSVIRVCPKLPGGISLGRYIFIGRWNEDIVEHEYGHSLQSIALGPLYLFVIGIPSLIWAATHGSRDYYSFYTERWANFWARKKINEL